MAEERDGSRSEDVHLHQASSTPQNMAAAFCRVDDKKMALDISSLRCLKTLTPKKGVAVFPEQPFSLQKWSSLACIPYPYIDTMYVECQKETIPRLTTRGAMLH